MAEGIKNDDFDFGFGDDPFGDALFGLDDDLESEHIPDPRAMKMAARLEVRRITREQALADIVPNPPKPNQSIHVVSGAKFDFWSWIPQMVNWMGGKANQFYCSTWTLSRPNAVEMLARWDAGDFNEVAFLTGLYFKRRESAVYAYLLEGIKQRGGRYKATPNHAKVLLLNDPKQNIWLVVEGSANLTSNPRFEQYVITNSRELWEFHQEWMEEVLAR